MDIGGQPSLVDIDAEGKVPLGRGHNQARRYLYVIDRRDGSLVVPAPEKPVPTSNPAAGDTLSPTQPFSALTLPERNISEADAVGHPAIRPARPASSSRNAAMKARSRKRRSRVPSSRRVHWASSNGAVPPSIPVRQLVIVNPDYMGFLEKLVPRAETTAKSGTGGGEMGLA